MSDEQLSIAGKYLDPIFWEEKIKQHPDDVENAREVFKGAGV
jgi:hypothetical protein